MDRVYLNGQFLPADEARISISDRGFLFGDAVYEVIPAYHGRPFRLGEHLQRLRNSLGMIGIASPHQDLEWAGIIDTLLAGLPSGDQSIYIQITRGAGENRDVAAFAGLQPTILVRVAPVTLDRARLRDGIRVALLDDIRWQLCQIKTTALLGNVLLRRQAQELGASEAVLCRDGEITEGASSNVFAVRDGRLHTAPADHRILRGITRDLVIELAQRCALPLSETAVSRDCVRYLDELFICSSIREIVPVIAIAGHAVANGLPGPLTLRLMAALAEFKAGLGAGT